MRIRTLTAGLAMAITLVTTTASIAAGQTTRPTMGVSYSFLRLLEGPDLNMPAGWLVSFAAPVERRSPFAVVGEIAGNYRSAFGETFHTYTIQGGFRVSGRTQPGVDPYGQFLLGVMNNGCCGGSVTNFMIEPGVGIDLAMSRGLAFRAGLSLPIAFDEGDAFKALRLQAGVVFPIASR